MEIYKVTSKGFGISTVIESDVIKYTEEALKNFKGSNKKIVGHISQQLSLHHKGQWSVLVLDGLETKWEIEYFQVEDKHISFSHSNHQFFVWRSL